jgi:hypothetical protein
MSSRRVRSGAIHFGVRGKALAVKQEMGMKGATGFGPLITGMKGEDHGRKESGKKDDPKSGKDFEEGCQRRGCL